jgi:hypothetical protein
MAPRLTVQVQLVGIRMPVLIAGGAAYGALLAWAGATIAGITAQATLPDLYQLASRTELLSRPRLCSATP